MKLLAILLLSLVAFSAATREQNLVAFRNGAPTDNSAGAGAGADAGAGAGAGAEQGATQNSNHATVPQTQGQESTPEVEAGHNELGDYAGHVDLVHTTVLHTAKNIDPKDKLANAAEGATVLHPEEKAQQELDRIRDNNNKYPAKPDTAVSNLAPNAAQDTHIMANNLRLHDCDEHPCGPDAEKLYPETKGTHSPWHLPVTPEYMESSDHIVPEVNEKFEHLANTVFTEPHVEGAQVEAHEAKPIQV